jgi:transcriptional regulator with XRE-family HTH domain
VKTSRSKTPAVVPANPDAEESHPRLGDALRAIRFRKRLSIADVSAATGLARSTLSRVENHQLSLTYDRLVRLCRGLQVDLSELFSVQARPPEPKVFARRAVTPPGGGTPVVVGQHAYSYLCTDLPGKQMTPMTAVIKARSFAETNGFLRHEGEEFTFVLQGVLELHTEYYNPLRVETGGSVYFDSTMGHTYVAAGEGPTTILCVCSEADTVLKEALQGPLETAQPEPPPPRRQQKAARK